MRGGRVQLRTVHKDGSATTRWFPSNRVRLADALETSRWSFVAGVEIINVEHGDCR